MTTTAAIWGISWVCGRVIAADGVPPFTAASARFLFGSLGLLGVMMMRRPWPRIDFELAWKLAAMGFFGVFLYNLCFFTGLRTVPAGRASLLASLQPVFVFLGSVLFWREGMTSSKIAGLLLGLAGASLVLSQGMPTRLFRSGLNTGDLWVLGCAISWAAYTLVGRMVMGRISAIAATAYSTWFGTAALMAFSIPRSPSSAGWSAQIWMAAAFLGIAGTTIAFLLYLKGVGQIGASRASIFINLVPVFAVISSYFLLGEAISASTLTGGAIVIAGVYLLNR
ncbi:MAG: DMT family transporter [Bryobacteraceae bacterium]